MLLYFDPPAVLDLLELLTKDRFLSFSSLLDNRLDLALDLSRLSLFIFGIGHYPSKLFLQLLAFCLELECCLAGVLKLLL